MRVNCLNCGKEFKTSNFYLANGRGKHCSIECANISKSKLTPWNKGKHTGFAPWLGKKRPDMEREKNHAWTGENGKYNTKHNWIRKKYGKPQKCEHCGTIEVRMYHWANISGRYKRDIEDWIRLCVPCHSKFDRFRNT